MPSLHVSRFVPPCSARAPLWVLVPLVAALTGACGSGGGNAPDVVVTISPTTASVAAGQTVQFTATVSGSDNAKINWSASGGNISSGGLYTAPALGGGYTVRATADANAKDSATGLVNVMGSDSWPVEPFYESSHPYVQVMTPMPFATYFAPATIRVWAHAPDPGSKVNDGYSPRVEFYLGTMMVASIPATANAADYYEFDIKNVPTGTYELSVRSLLNAGTVESFHVPVVVIDPPTGHVMTLTSDLVLSGNTSFELIGTADQPAVLTSTNGSRIRSADGWTGHLKIQHADIIGLGKMDVPGIEVTVGGNNALEISDSIFDACGPPKLGAEGQATIAFNRNTLQPSILTPVSDQPDYGDSHPSLWFTGGSTGAKTFQGNNIGVSFVRFERTGNWTVGGDHDADGNILIGVRGGMEFDTVSGNLTIQGNFSYHRYPFGWSQGHNLDFIGDNASALVRDNVFRSSSWMIQSLPPGTQFQYNLLLDDINEAFFRDFGSTVKVHHNLLVNASWQRVFLPSGGVLSGSGEFTNNTVDVGGAKLGWFANSFIRAEGAGPLKAQNNVFMGFAYDNQTDLIGSGAVSTADHNAFYNPDTTKLRPYADAGKGAGDVNGDPKFAPREIPFQVSDGDIWRRRVTVSQILSHYATLYTPGAGSPLSNAGSDGENIGAIGDGRFGMFGP